VAAVWQAVIVRRCFDAGDEGQREGYTGKENFPR
jgi:hypothetical protein